MQWIIWKSLSDSVIIIFGDFLLGERFLTWKVQESSSFTGHNFRFVVTAELASLASLFMSAYTQRFITAQTLITTYGSFVTVTPSWQWFSSYIACLAFSSHQDFCPSTRLCCNAAYISKDHIIPAAVVRQKKTCQNGIFFLFLKT